MNLADVFTIFFIIIGFVIAFVSYWLMAAGLFPALVQRTAERFASTPVKATLLGAVTAIPVIFAGMVFSGKAPNAGLKLAGLVVALVPILLALLGSAGLALRIGTGLRSSRDEIDPWRRVLRGSVVLGLTFILPVIGWFGVLPLTLVSGFGAFLLAVFSKAHRVPVLAPISEVPTAAALPVPVPLPVQPAAVLHSVS